MGRLFWKFFLSILLAQVTATIGIGGTFWLKERAMRLQQAQDIDSSPPAQSAIDAAAATLQFGGADALRQFLDQMQRHRVMAVDESGHDILQREVKAALLLQARHLLGQPDKQRVVREVSAADGHRYLLFLPFSEHFRRFFPGGMVPPLADGKPNPAPGPAYDGARPPAMRGLPPVPIYSPFRSVIPIVGATLASLLFAFLLAWYFSRPIRELRQAFEAASGGDLAPRFGPPGKHSDELQALGYDFDRMTGRLRSLMDGQTRLLHDVSHELRSPLARLQAAIGLAHQQPDKMAASMERIERESVRMDKLVGELLTLSRLEAGALHAMGEDISIADLIDEISGDARFEAASRTIAIGVAGEADVTVAGHADLLGRAVENVVRNAIKHSPEGGAVELEVGVQDHGQSVRIAVLDRGPGVAQADLKAIFQPFFRAANTEKTEGHGLGLAIARHVVQVHRGTISAHNRDGGGLCVEILLPLKQD
ncbi:ATP-binding protein [Janthinobacterium agaricidamnosum]|uniref:histidine kinase n=1 Tax=Janthinobacterium agaricidamnosum NBRC 102515 = DSM 9628 TaxID=1349767 RepID=W0V4N3_9BURK|nr:ATP-binding protein [Janthinobacterium agaricidamnosum]CDG82836.1 HAMP domain protein [Janthinobacterium agaricidamnosum NBRC 102515 = DSM 9628]